jgi:hypothetical protein
LNSTGVEPAVHNLFENLKHGLVILQAFDKVLPGTVIWRRVSKPSGSKLGTTELDENESGEFGSSGGGGWRVEGVRCEGFGLGVVLVVPLVMLVLLLLLLVLRFDIKRQSSRMCVRVCVRLRIRHRRGRICGDLDFGRWGLY